MTEYDQTWLQFVFLLHILYPITLSDLLERQHLPVTAKVLFSLMYTTVDNICRGGSVSSK